MARGSRAYVCVRETVKRCVWRGAFGDTIRTSFAYVVESPLRPSPPPSPPRYQARYYQNGGKDLARDLPGAHAQVQKPGLKKGQVEQPQQVRFVAAREPANSHLTAPDYGNDQASAGSNMPSSSASAEGEADAGPPAGHQILRFARQGEQSQAQYKSTYNSKTGTHQVKSGGTLWKKRGARGETMSRARRAREKGHARSRERQRERQRERDRDGEKEREEQEGGRGDANTHLCARF